jgi:hypothetical protein
MTDGSWTEEGTEAKIFGPKTRLYFSLGKEMCKRRLCKGHYLRSRLRWGNSEGGCFAGDFEKQVTIWRAPPLGTPKDIASGNWHLSFYGPVRGTWMVGSFTRY